MRQIFKEYGGVIIVVIAVVALIGLVSLLMQPGGVLNGAFGNIVQSFVDKSESLIDVAGEGTGGSGGAGGSGEENSPALNPNGTVPAGAYYGNVVAGEFYTEMPSTVSAGDIYIYGDYVYEYKTELGGWLVYLATVETGIQTFVPTYPVVTRNQSAYGEILETINGVPVNSLGYMDSEGAVCEGTFMMSAVVVAPTLPKTITNITGAFSDCAQLTTVVLPEGLETVGDSAFRECENLVNITIPSSVTSIEGSAFSVCYGLTEINFEGTVEQWNAISFGETWNWGCDAITVYCNNGTVTVPKA